MEIAMSEAGNGIDDIATLMARQAEQAQKDLAVAEAALSQRDLQTRQAKIARDAASDMLKRLQDMARRLDTESATQDWYGAFFGAEAKLASPPYEQLKNSLKEYEKEVKEILEQW